MGALAQKLRKKGVSVEDCTTIAELETLQVKVRILGGIDFLHDCAVFTKIVAPICDTALAQESTKEEMQQIGEIPVFSRIRHTTQQLIQIKNMLQEPPKSPLANVETETTAERRDKKRGQRAPYRTTDWKAEQRQEQTDKRRERTEEAQKKQKNRQRGFAHKGMEGELAAIFPNLKPKGEEETDS